MNISIRPRQVYALFSVILLTLLSACGSPPSPYQGIKIGKPYVVSGHVYVPKYNPGYDETGIASWYGPGFHGERTASGERYDQNDMTAAHKTLPMPSMVRVTNLNNGRSAIIRINDRGPFSSGRIIDLSHAAAKKLGVLKTGTAKVRVQFLDKETREYVSNLPGGAKSLKLLDQLATSQGHDNEEIAVTDMDAIDTQPLPFVAPIPVTQPAASTNNAIQVAENTAPTPAAEPHEIKKPVTVNTASGAGYFVQAGTFGIKDNADRLLLELVEMGNAKIVENSVKQKKFYRVLAGPYNSRGDADSMLSKLAAIGISGAKVIRD